MTTRTRTSQRDAAVAIVKRLQEAGHVAYLAGGCVRDTLLGIEPKDYDVATDARPDVVRRLFPRSQFVGEAFGVVLVYELRQAIEVATFRKEWGYTDGRRPDGVDFTDAEHDAQRRDFTINGLFADPFAEPRETAGGSTASPLGEIGRIIDYVGGRKDLDAKLIRAVGDPAERFAEDYLRMLRAVRFAARLNFELESRTAMAIRPLTKYLGQISRERIGQEVQMMLLHPTAVAATQLLEQLRLDAPVLNEEHRDTTPHVLSRLIEQTSNDAEYPARLLAWMLDRHVRGLKMCDLRPVVEFTHRGATRAIGRWRKALCLSNETRDTVRDSLALIATLAGWDDAGKAQRKRWLALPVREQAMHLLAAITTAEWFEPLQQQTAALLEEGVAPLAYVNGEDLIARSLKPGPRFKTLLDSVYDAQLDGRVQSRPEALAFLDAMLAGKT